MVEILINDKLTAPAELLAEAPETTASFTVDTKKLVGAIMNITGMACLVLVLCKVCLLSDNTRAGQPYSKLTIFK
jgi:hypothetical protein